jgi:hypothetical protein
MADYSRLPPLLRAALQLRAENNLTAYFLKMAYDSGNTPPLSTSAQTVFDAAWTLPITPGDTETTRRRQIAATLRAAADQLVLDPEINSQGGMLLSCKDQLCDIANELDGIAKTGT